MTQKSDDEVIPPDLLDALLAAGDAVALPASRQAVLKARVLDRVRAPTFSTLKAADRHWEPFAPGVARVVLHEAGGVQSWLARLEAGARFPAHGHSGDEESLVLEGSCQVDALVLHAGDYHLARAGTRHGEVYSAAGCVLLIRSRTERRRGATVAA